jgi:hypothetical protein
VTVACVKISAIAAEPPRAARSVHLSYAAGEGDLFYNEVTVEQSTPGSYFMACGWNTGYFGMQQLRSPTNKVVIFSVWDPTKGDDANKVPLEQRVEVLHEGTGVKVKRFGGEGTGGNAKYRCAWANGERCRFLVRAEVEDQKTAYTGFFKRDADKEWKKLATFRVKTGGQSLKGYYSFVEDFRRDGKSPNERRAALYGPGWVRSPKKEWTPIRQASFGADATKLDTIDATVSPEGFTLSTGGATVQSRKLRSVLALEDGPRVLPDDLP